MFTKAKPEQGFIKMSLYGPPGAGKTFTTLLLAEYLAEQCGKRIAYVDTERGTDFYALEVSARSIHPAAFDFDALYTTSLADVIESVQALDPEQYGVIVIDSISHLWDAAIAAYEGKKTKIDSIPMHAWGAIKKPYKHLIRWLMDSPYHVFILGRQKNLFETNPDTDQLIKVGVGMRAEGETEYEPHICARMESKKDEKDSSVSTIRAIFEKDRTGILAGRTYVNPKASILDPVLPLLNGHQAQSQDPDEVAARDSELLEKDKAKQAKKDEKSKALLAQLTANINAASTFDELAAVATDIKKEKRYIMEDHLNALRSLYESAHAALSAKAAPSEV